MKRVGDCSDRPGGAADKTSSSPRASSSSTGRKASFFDAFGAGIDRTLCFANPIKDDSKEDNAIVAAAEARDEEEEERTLNTCEDTNTVHFSGEDCSWPRCRTFILTI